LPSRSHSITGNRYFSGSLPSSSSSRGNQSWRPAEKGRDLLKQVRTQLIETARAVLEGMVKEITGVKVLSLHHDISTATGEEIVLFTLAASPDFRETKKK
jgi:uncharacterized protein YbcI